jgi:hypothetical protein
MGERKEKIVTNMCVFRERCGDTPKTTVNNEKHDRQQWGMTGQGGEGAVGCVGVTAGVLLLLLLLFTAAFAAALLSCRGCRGCGDARRSRLFITCVTSTRRLAHSGH